jgi:selenocysteine lyase/cysteine desulfurase
VLKNRAPLWLESEQSLDAAHERIKQLLASDPSDYMIFCHNTQDKILIPAEPNVAASATDRGNEA